MTAICYIATFISQTSSLGNIVHLNVIGFERLLAVAKPMYWRSIMTNSLSMKIIICTWMFIIAKTVLEMAFGRKEEGGLLTCATDTFFDEKVLNISIIGSFFLISIFTSIFLLGHCILCKESIY